jgi:predicted nicotinamide N-methyase
VIHSSPAYCRLLARIQRRYRTLTEPVALSGREYSFTRIADPNRVLHDIAATEDRLEKTSGLRKNGDDLHLPYWAELWDSALAMGQWLIERFPAGADRRVDREPTTVLDLGCGMGFPGMVAASLGLGVCYADLEPPALLFAKLNSLPYTPAARARRLNWRTGTLGERFDLILGADILYEREQWDFLEPFWRAHLSRGGSVILGEPGRQTGDRFPAWIASRGWTIELHRQTVTTRARPIRLFELRLVKPEHPVD